MNTLNYDVGNLGNHEFNFGLDFLNEAINDAAFPYISANVFKDDQDGDASNDENYIKPYLIKEKTFVDTTDKERKLKVDGIDAIMFGHSHRNFPGTDYAGIADQGVDIEKGSINGITAVMPGFWGNHLGQIDLSLVYQEKKWTVADYQSSVTPIFKRDENRNQIPLVEPDQALLEAVQEEHQGTIDWVAAPFAIGTFSQLLLCPGAG